MANEQKKKWNLDILLRAKVNGYNNGWRPLWRMLWMLLRNIIYKLNKILKFLFFFQFSGDESE